MATYTRNITIIGAGINGLVAANYLQRAGHRVTLLERSHQVGGACISATAQVDGIQHSYALGASTLGLMQDFVWRETGLADRLRIWAPGHPDLVWFPGQRHPTRLDTDPVILKRELHSHWGEQGDVAAFMADEERVVAFLQAGYRRGEPPSVDATREALGDDLTRLWITGTARDLLTHYFTEERTRVNAAMDVSESGPVSIDEPFSAFILPMMSSGSVFGGDYGYVRGGIWKITAELGRINAELGVDTVLDCSVHEVSIQDRRVHYSTAAGDKALSADHVIFATDPQTAARLAGDTTLQDIAHSEQILGTSGKLNLLFQNPVRWKDSVGHADADTAFRYVFAVDSLEDLNAAALSVATGNDFTPGYFQVYCEGASMRQMGLNEPFDRLAVFFKNLGLGQTGDTLVDVEAEVKATILNYIDNPEDLVWSRLLTPRDLQQTFGFPGGNIEHTMLVAGQCYFDRNYSEHPGRRFYQFGHHENLSICGSSTYPCGSVAGTPAYMCVKELMQHFGV